MPTSSSIGEPPANYVGYITIECRTMLVRWMNEQEYQ
jgi:hypothetical protein